MQQVKPTILKETRKQDTHSLFITTCKALAFFLSVAKKINEGEA